MIEKKNMLHCGIDIGSTTAKTVVIDYDNNIVFKAYERHNADVKGTLKEIFKGMQRKLGDVMLNINLTGSAGMGLSEMYNIPFVQEVVSSADAARKYYKGVKTLIDVGGEDSKMIFFNDQGQADIRMNGSCAGGTGAFIDQMAALIDVPVTELNSIAENYTHVYPIASRCGVFAKTDVQNLLSRKIPKSDIAISIYHAVALQALNTLSRGFDIQRKVLFCGGPFAFIPMLRHVFMEKMQVMPEDIIIPEHPELIPAIGAALNDENEPYLMTIETFMNTIDIDNEHLVIKRNREMPLFSSSEEFERWNSKRYKEVPHTDIPAHECITCFIGIDAGSTTTKLVLLDKEGRILDSFYEQNKGDHVAAVQKGLQQFHDNAAEKGSELQVKQSCVTGYGEDLIKTVFNLDYGIVETISHYEAAKIVEPDVDFVLDIGGQDMKALFIANNTVRNIEINEACSSGCGSFIQTFANTLGHDVQSFAMAGCYSSEPCSLGSRCTVFMNSRVKQALKEGASIGDISAGLAYSVVKNCINKVLKLRDFTHLGEKIVLQGGTFKNPAVHKAFEKLTGKKIVCPDITGIMGAYGAALFCRKKATEHTDQLSSFIGFDKLHTVSSFDKKYIECKGCENCCTITKMILDEQRVFYTGNKCEKIFSSNGERAERHGYDIAEYKRNLLFNRDMRENKKGITIGIPRVLNMFENFPFWNTLFVESGLNVALSSPSTMKLYEKGAGTVMSDNICFPAKLVHGHILDLVDKEVDRIFYPMVIFENYDSTADNTFNCPIVSGYPDVVKSSINPEHKYNIPLDKPTVSFKDVSLLKKSCWNYLKNLGVQKTTFKAAFKKAMTEQRVFKAYLKAKAQDIVARAEQEGRTVLMLVGRPYHLDPLINHKIPEMITALGVDIISGDSAPVPDDLGDIKVLNQWAYPSRLYAAAKYAAEHPNVEIIQLNSFGCGPDAVTTDEMKEILSAADKNLAVIRIDEIASPGSAKLRLRTLIESLKLKSSTDEKPIKKERPDLPIFEEKDQGRLVLFPYFAKFYSPFVESAFREVGINAKILPETDQRSLELGLKYANNEICYPAILVVGDIIKVLQSGKYSRDEIAIGITQTGGQCRASNYLGMIKKAMITAGYDNIPLVGLTTSPRSFNNQPGFTYSKLELVRMCLNSVLFGDALSMLHHSMLPREKERGATEKVSNYYISLWQSKIKNAGRKELLSVLKDAVRDYNAIETVNTPIPQIGLVGEIYVKYSAFGNHNVVDWLSQNRVEVVIPNLIDFFIQELINVEINKKSMLKKADLMYWISPLIEKSAMKHLNKMNNVLKDFKHYKPFHDVRKLSQKASKAINLVNQFGEGWLITAEIMQFAEDGVSNILCLQPFGCISNQIIAKGVEKKLKDIYPNLNLLFIDLDSDTSEANFMNRLHFLVKGAKDTINQSSQSISI